MAGDVLVGETDFDVGGSFVAGLAATAAVAVAMAAIAGRGEKEAEEEDPWSATARSAGRRWTELRPLDRQLLRLWLPTAGHFVVRPLVQSAETAVVGRMGPLPLRCQQLLVLF